MATPGLRRRWKASSSTCFVVRPCLRENLTKVKSSEVLTAWLPRDRVNAVVDVLQNVLELPIDADVLDVHFEVVPRGDEPVEVNGMFARIEDQR